MGMIFYQFLTLRSIPCCPTIWRSYHNYRLLWCHCSLCIRYQYSWRLAI